MQSIGRVRLTALAASLGLAFTASPASAEWVASWQSSPHAPLAESGPFAAASFEDVTLTQIVKLSQGGDRLRVRFTNRYGRQPLTIGGARIVRIDDAGEEIEGSGRVLTFAGQTNAVIPIGAPFLSDAVAIDLPDLSRVKIEFYLPEATGPCTCHSVGLDALSVSPAGNFVGEDFAPVEQADYRAFIAGVEVDSSTSLGTIVTYGDSITDGYGSTPGANARWPDFLARRLQAAGQDWAIANAAISGNRLLTPGMGDAALARFSDDVLALPNVRYVILFIGVNDIGMSLGEMPTGGGDVPDFITAPITLDEMKAGYTQLVERAHQHGIAVIASPIAPYKGAEYWSEEGEALRLEVNEWILASGVFDGIVRFDAAFADPADPQQMHPDYHIGDHLHGNDAGYEALAEAIELSLFESE